jgi:uncharacterized protein YbjT (DUF2867 family)
LALIAGTFDECSAADDVAEHDRPQRRRNAARPSSKAIRRICGGFSMRRVLVTGATGNVGRRVVSELQRVECQIRALTRHPDRASLPCDVEVVRGDLADAESLDRCLEDVDAVFLVWTSPADAAPAAVDRIARHTRHVVLLTSPHTVAHPFFQQPNPLRALHADLERLIEESGVQWTFLRPGMFAINALTWWAPQIRAGSVVRWPYAAAPTAPIHERDIAAVAATALVEPGHDEAEYVVTGPASLTQLEQVATIGEVIGKPLRYEEISPDEARRELNFPAPAVTMLLDAWSAAIGQPAYVTDTVAAVTGTPARTYREWVTDHVGAFDS